MQRPGSKKTNAQVQENEPVQGAERTASQLESGGVREENDGEIWDEGGKLEPESKRSSGACFFFLT